MLSAKRLHRIQIYCSLFLTGVVAFAVVFSYSYGFFRIGDYYLYDLHIKWRGTQKISDKIVLVLMDEKSAAELNRHKETWSRRQLGTAIRNLSDAGAEVIGLDMVMSSPDLDHENDMFLAKAIKDSNNVVLSRVSASHAGEILPLPIFEEGMIGDGFIDVPLDEDEILRKIRFLNAKPLPDGNLQLSPAFSLELARSFFNIDFFLDFSEKDYFLIGSQDDKKLRLPYPELIINYKGDYTLFQQIPYADVVTNRFPSSKVKGKIILFGSSLAAQKDFFSTPFTRFQDPVKNYKDKFGTVVDEVLGVKDPGVSCHAYALETILSQEFIKHISRNIVILLTIILGAAGLVFYIPAITFMWEALILFAGLFAITAFSHLLFIKNLIWLDIAPFLCILICQFVSGVMLQKNFDKKRTAHVTGLFGRYVSPGVVDNIIKGDIETTLKGQSQELSILFSDLRNFTTLSEELGPKDTSILLNTYFDAMIPIVFKHKGTLDKLIGDAIMAFFGAPVSFADHPEKAAETALDMMAALKKLKLMNVRGMDKLNLGIGLNTGTVTIGNLGSNEFMDYTIIGDAVNLASRLEGLNKIYGTNIMASEFTAQALGNKFLLREIDIVRVKGKENFVKIFEIAGFAENAGTRISESINVFHEGLSEYRTKKWDNAQNLFKKTLELSPSDGPSLLYLKRIDKFRLSPPPDAWNGTAIFESK
ncbi:MAG: adenylate/guanylate cyclase domain-containing protein [Proteobacteria bacterium]|nr:adenylate/guanylate cyclase domain-containing protein [Pseudomonadota bacterium]